MVDMMIEVVDTVAVLVDMKIDRVVDMIEVVTVVVVAMGVVARAVVAEAMEVVVSRLASHRRNQTGPSEEHEGTHTHTPQQQQQ